MRKIVFVLLAVLSEAAAAAELPATAAEAAAAIVAGQLEDHEFDHGDFIAELPGNPDEPRQIVGGCMLDKVPQHFARRVAQSASTCCVTGHHPLSLSRWKCRSEG